MDDFNEVRKQEERYGSLLNVHGADAFNLFILSAGLEEVPLGGCSFTWCHKTATKMSKLDRFFIFESLMGSCPNIPAVTLDRFLSDHRSILLRESHFDYGPIPTSLRKELAEIDKLLDKGEGNSNVLQKRTSVLNSLQEFDKLESMEVAQKAKIKWAIEGDENSKYYHGVLNKKRNQLAIRAIGSVIVNGSPTCEFQFYKGLKLGDPLSPFLFLLIMESLHISVQRVVNAVVEDNRVEQAAAKIGCATLKAPFSYLGSKVRGIMSRIQSWNEIVDKLVPMKVLQRSLMFKWVWRFRTQSSSLWARVIKGIHGEDDSIGKNSKHHHTSIWLDIFREVELLKRQGRLEGDVAFKYLFPRIYALESHKHITVASKLSHDNIIYFFRRAPRGGMEQFQFLELLGNIEGISLADSRDRWSWSLEGSGEFSVASVRRLIDENILPEFSTKTRWFNVVPIKINIHAWKVKLDCLLTKLNISKRGMLIDSILCPLCGKAVEASSHIFFACHIVREVFLNITRWWDIPYVEVSTYEEWLIWLSNLRLHSKHKHLLEGVCYVM
ncbi:RNA-directed DNA polymerase, eukaryota, reverse transcriptase zinc-binding domain protein [Tanacetum coccineum]